MGTYKQPKKRIMRKLRINEVSGVDVPAQAGARVEIIKRADDERIVEKFIVLTSEVDGHQHAIDIDSYHLKEGGGHTGYAKDSKEQYEHSHAYVINADGTITIATNQSHTHELEMGDLFTRLNLQSALSTVEQRHPDADKLVGKSKGKNHSEPSEFALVPDPESPSTWKYRISKHKDPSVYKRRIGSAVYALEQGNIEKQYIKTVTRRVRLAWLDAYKHKSPSELPSILKRV